MAEYPQSIKIYAYLVSTWTDITSDVVESISGYWGMGTNRESDRVAAIGHLYFTLDNTSTKYTPNIGASLTGWGKGTKIKLVIKYRDREHIRFKGFVDSIKITGGVLGLRRVYVTVKDWLDYANKYPLQSPGIQTNKRADEGLITIKNAMPIQPDAYTFATGDETFPNIFDTVTKKTTAIGEFNKFALSEMGYIYLRKDWNTGENLRFENRRFRKGTDTQTTYSVPAADNGFLLAEDGTYLLAEDGTKLIIESAETLSLAPDNNMQNVEVEYGANVLNRITIVAYPRKVDTSAAVLFSLGYPMQIGAGETITFRGTYFDPVGGAVVNADSSTMITPASTTDYLMNTASDGSGTNKTASLTITAVYGTEGVTYTLTNTDSATCYITKLQARGYGIYTYATLESIVEDSTSYTAYGYYSDVIAQMYQQNTVLGKQESRKILDNYKQPRTILNKVYLQGNKSASLLFGFLMYDVGDMVNVKEDQSGIDSDYYIQGVGFNIQQAQTGGIIDYTWNVKQAQNLSSGDYGYSLIAPEFSNAGTVLTDRTNSLYFGCVNYLNNITSKSFSLWFYLIGNKGVIYMKGGIIGVTGKDLFGSRIYVDSSISRIYLSEFDGNWYSSTAVSTGAWHHLVITKQSSAINTAPLIYLDGTLQTTITQDAQTFISSETGHELYIGKNIFGSGADVTQSIEGKIKDFRIYDTILTSSQVTTLYNEGAGGTSVTGNLQFQAPVVKKSDLTYFTDHTMTASDMVIDNIYGVIGTAQKHPSWTYPITRLP